MTDPSAETTLAASGLDCSCLTLGPRYPDVIPERPIGRDERRGRFADVGLIRCALCRRLWLRYHVEYEAFTASGRWAEAIIDDAAAAAITPEQAAGYLDSAAWYIFGGSYFGHTGKRGSGRLNWDI